MVTAGLPCYDSCWLSEEHSEMGILPRVFRVMAAPHRRPYGHNHDSGNVPAFSCMIRSELPRNPDDSCRVVRIRQLFDLQVQIIVPYLTDVPC